VSHITRLARSTVEDMSATYHQKYLSMLWNAVENYSSGKLLKTKDERKPQEEQTTYLVAAVESEAFLRLVDICLYMPIYNTELRY
jgi:hypothetical protein